MPVESMNVRSARSNVTVPPRAVNGFSASANVGAASMSSSPARRTSHGPPAWTLNYPRTLRRGRRSSGLQSRSIVPGGVTEVQSDVRGLSQ